MNDTKQLPSTASVVVTSDDLPKAIAKALGMLDGHQYQLNATAIDMFSHIDETTDESTDAGIPVVSLQYETPAPEGTNSDAWEAAAAEIKSKK